MDLDVAGRAVDALDEEDFGIFVGVLELVMGARGRVGPIPILLDREGSEAAFLGAGDEQLGAVDVGDGEGAGGRDVLGGVAFGQPDEGAGDHGRVVGAGDEDVDRGGAEAAVREPDRVGEAVRRRLALGQIVEPVSRLVDDHVLNAGGLHCRAGRQCRNLNSLVGSSWSSEKIVPAEPRSLARTSMTTNWFSLVVAVSSWA